MSRQAWEPEAIPSKPAHASASGGFSRPAESWPKAMLAGAADQTHDARRCCPLGVPMAAPPAQGRRFSIAGWTEKPGAKALARLRRAPRPALVLMAGCLL